ncbi:C40 family peptidase [Macrococcoides caseolyticum]|uniref:C40 family peptidase n=1 Tax=Macrococcoides caseolyticum TaxID=69966 RepID=UPI001F38B10F|nr:LysM peptidoglycan-binding domain-containing protein [Macrococcus caseolyticus]MCE4955844.1 LysM peptidoglycan-binding domain-containing protein [Macrococcus caseolyticus]
MRKSRKLFLSSLMIATLFTSEVQASIYQVQKGDTLLTIAKETKTSVVQLKRLNHLKTSRVIPGQKLKLKPQQVYRVKDGDTVQSIAKQFKIQPFEVRFWNRLISNELHVGQKLIVSESLYRKKHRSKRTESVTPTLSPAMAARLNEIEAQERLIHKRDAALEASTTDDDFIIARDNRPSNDSDVAGQFVKDFNHQDNDALYKTKASDDRSYPEEQNNIQSEEKNDIEQIALRIAQGKRYVYGANSTTEVDCSSFVQQVMQSIGKSLPRTTYEQITVGHRVAQPKPGDLVFFNQASHVGIYIGNGQMIDALNPKEGIGKRSVDDIDGTITGYYRY